MSQEQNQVKKTKVAIRRVVIEPGQIIRIVHPETGTVFDVAIDLSVGRESICYRYSSDELGLLLGSASSRFIDSLLFV